MKQGLVRLLYNFGKRFMGWTLHMIMCVLLCYPVSIRIYYQQGVLFLVGVAFCTVNYKAHRGPYLSNIIQSTALLWRQYLLYKGTQCNTLTQTWQK